MRSAVIFHTNAALKLQSTLVIHANGEKGSRGVEKAWVTPSGFGWLWSVLHGVSVPDSSEQF